MLFYLKNIAVHVKPHEMKKKEKVNTLTIHDDQILQSSSINNSWLLSSFENIYFIETKYSS